MGGFYAPFYKQQLYISIEITNYLFDLPHITKHADFVLADVGYRCRTKAYAQQQFGKIVCSVLSFSFVILFNVSNKF
jgi:hypothetical protein